jgi:UDP-N-acetylmuramoyl-L-alanyl-D-glutamate--2,6-diaminopimelate ligase
VDFEVSTAPTSPPSGGLGGAGRIVVENSSSALGKMASNFYSNPSSNLKLVGVTGTNGKTTIATLLYQLTMSLGIKAGLISTVCNYICGQKVDSTHTTPDALELNRLLAEMVNQGCEYCFMEVSSHSVVQHRIAGLTFAGGIFTNLTQAHLDYHKTMDAYRDAKKLFFDNLPKTAFALTNLDDKNGEFMLQNTKAEKFTCSTRTLADFKTKIIESDFDGMELLIEQRTKSKEQGQFHIFTPFIGKFNAQNLTAVFGAATILFTIYNSQFTIEEIVVKLSALNSVSGRFEVIRGGGVTAIVDYAHTPDALKYVLATINDIRLGNSSVITVVGCGGNRDKGKRPLMAHEAVIGSNRVIFTSDNPRNEDPQAIIDDMSAGLSAMEKSNVLCIINRKEAIKTACALAQKGDVILIAGKGHEDYQIINDVKYHFDDKEEVLGQLKIKN